MVYNILYKTNIAIDPRLHRNDLCLQCCLRHWSRCLFSFYAGVINRLTPNDPYRRRTAPLTYKRFILYIYSTNTGTEYFKNGIYSSFPSIQNAVCFIILTYLVPVLFTFHIQGVLKLKENNSGANRSIKRKQIMWSRIKYQKL